MSLIYYYFLCDTNQVHALRKQITFYKKESSTLPFFDKMPPFYDLF